MKTLLLTLLFVFSGEVVSAQIFKDFGRKIKNDAENRVRQKVDQQVNKALDSAISKTTTKPKENTTKDNNTTGNTPSQQSNQPPNNNSTITSSTSSTTPSNQGQMNIGDGYVELYLSANEVFRNGTVIIQGSSIKYDNLQKVQLHIKGPETDEKESLPLFDNNSFTKSFQPERSGEYTITVKSSDGKASKTEKLKVVDIELTDWEVNAEETQKVLDKVKKEVRRAEESIGQKDRAELERRLGEVEEKVAAVQKFYNSLGAAMNELGLQTSQGGQPSPELASNLSQLNDLLADQRSKMTQLANKANHEPYDNTVCEYLVMVNEACAAFSTFTNLWAKSATALLKNIVLDKGVPKAVEVANNNTIKAGQPNDFILKEGGKIFTNAKYDMESLTSKLGKAGIAGDVVQYVSDVLLKTYCGVIKGEMSHDYAITYRNSAGAPWWSYSYDTKAAITLRYPKKNGSGSIIKMKGNIEGNATRFGFFQDVEEMDDFKEAMKGRAKLIPIEVYKPIAVPFATSQYDELGFGALARGVATPSYFNIPVDAEYNTDNNTIKLFLNEPLVDFLPTVQYIYGYIVIAASIPLVRRVEFPINKAKLTMNAVVSKNNELIVTKDATNNLIIKGQGNRHIGDASSPIEHKINYSLSARNDQ